MVIAYPATEARLAEIAAGILVHVTGRENREGIVVNDHPSTAEIGENCTVDLRASQGFQLGKLLRDYSVIDPYVTSDSSWGSYLYFFLGEPGWWASFKNLSPWQSWSTIQQQALVIRISGRCFVAAAGRQPLFYRPDDGAVVLRGTYRGPARVI